MSSLTLSLSRELDDKIMKIKFREMAIKKGRLFNNLLQRHYSESFSIVHEQSHNETMKYICIHACVW